MHRRVRRHLVPTKALSCKENDLVEVGFLKEHQTYLAQTEPRGNSENKGSLCKRVLRIRQDSDMLYAQSSTGEDNQSIDSNPCVLSFHYTRDSEESTPLPGVSGSSPRLVPRMLTEVFLVLVAGIQAQSW